MSKYLVVVGQFLQLRLLKVPRRRPRTRYVAASQARSTRAPLPNLVKSVSEALELSMSLKLNAESSLTNSSEATDFYRLV